MEQMTRREKLRYLQSYGKIRREINLLEKQIDNILDQILMLKQTKYYPRAPKLSGMPYAAASGDNMASYIARLDELERKNEKDKRERIKKIETMNALRTEIEQNIDLIENETFRQILWARYIRLMTWKETSEFIHYSYTYTRMLLTRAIDALEIKR